MRLTITSILSLWSLGVQRRGQGVVPHRVGAALEGTCAGLARWVQEWRICVNRTRWHEEQGRFFRFHALAGYRAAAAMIRKSSVPSICVTRFCRPEKGTPAMPATLATPAIQRLYAPLQALLVTTIYSDGFSTLGSWWAVVELGPWSSVLRWQALRLGGATRTEPPRVYRRVICSTTRRPYRTQTATQCVLSVPAWTQRRAARDRCWIQPWWCAYRPL